MAWLEEEFGRCQEGSIVCKVFGWTYGTWPQGGGDLVGAVLGHSRIPMVVDTSFLLPFPFSFSLPLQNLVFPFTILSVLLLFSLLCSVPGIVDVKSWNPNSL